MTNEHHATKQIFALLAGTEAVALQQKEAEGVHKPSFHDMGFSLVLETPEGMIGLWSCWLGDQLYIGYPRQWTVSDDLIKQTLGVQDAQPVLQKKWVANGRTVDTMRQWAKFYGGRVEGGGRMWVDHVMTHSNGRRFYHIQNEQLKKLHYGHDGSGSIGNIGFTYVSEEELDAPTAKKEHVQPYRDAFIQLALAIAEEHGGVQKMHVEYEFTELTPALLANEGYTDIRYLDGSPRYYESMGGTIVYAKKDNEELVLRSGNSLVPWVNIRTIHTTSSPTLAQILNEALVF